MRESEPHAHTRGAHVAHAHTGREDGGRACMHRAGGAAWRASAVCTRPLHPSARVTLSPRVSTSQPTGTLRSGQRGRGGYNEAWLGRRRPRTAVFEQRELANTLMQHICKPKNTESSTTGGLCNQKRRKPRRNSGQRGLWE